MIQLIPANHLLKPLKDWSLLHAKDFVPNSMSEANHLVVTTFIIESISFEKNDQKFKFSCQN